MTDSFVPSDTEPQRQRPLSRRARVGRLGSLPLDSEQDLRFVQERIALLGKTTFYISTMFLIATAGTRGRGVLEALLWSIAGAAVSTLASTVIYGLRQKALEARQLGQYSLEEKIGEGGMGKVYRGRHAMLRGPTAVKLLSGDGSEEQLRRFEKCLSRRVLNLGFSTLGELE